MYQNADTNTNGRVQSVSPQSGMSHKMQYSPAMNKMYPQYQLGSSSMMVGNSSWLFRNSPSCVSSTWREIAVILVLLFRSNLRWPINRAGQIWSVPALDRYCRERTRWVRCRSSFSGTLRRSTRAPTTNTFRCRIVQRVTWRVTIPSKSRCRPADRSHRLRLRQ